MNAGRLIAVVGPSGVGKDSVMTAIAQRLPQIRMVRRVITRPAGLAGERYDATTPEAFETQIAQGAFCLHWDAHGLRYGIPHAVLTDVQAGRDCMVNFSRSALVAADRQFPHLIVLSITADAKVLAERLKARGRESAKEIAQRLAKADQPLPAGLDVITLPNTGALDETVDRAVQALRIKEVPG